MKKEYTAKETESLGREAGRQKAEQLAWEQRRPGCQATSGFANVPVLQKPPCGAETTPTT